MKNTPQIIFVIFILFLISLPLIFFDGKKTVSQKENRTLAKKPFFLEENQLNQKLFSQYDSYLQDHIGFRDYLIYLNSKNPLHMEKPTAFNHAIEGKDGWYFYIDAADGNNLRDFYKRNLLSEAELGEFKKRVFAAASWCAEQKIKCIFLVCPNKHSVYQEFYPFERPSGITRSDQLTEVFESLGVNYLFPRDYLLSKKSEYDVPLYYECGTHWNSLGAYLAFALLQEKIEKLFPDTDFPKIDWSVKATYKSTTDSMLPMMGLDASLAKSTQIDFEAAGCELSDFYTYLKNEGRDGVHTKGMDENLPRALIFRDSFFTALEPFVSPLFSEAEYRWKNFSDEDKSSVLLYKPDIIIFECVERCAPGLVR